ncbi:MAG: GH3 family domain-containing protein [Bdellovibrionota bacterium]
MINNFLIKQYAKFRFKSLQRQDIAEVQKRQLKKLVNFSKNTKFGKEHSFSHINSIKDFQNNVPLRTYEDLWDEYWKDAFPYLENITYGGKVPYFVVSSGTSSGTTKYIPYTKQMIRSNVIAGLDLLSYHYINNPDAKLLSGKSFLLGGSTDLVEEAPNIYSGDLSGVTTINIPWWVKSRYFPDEKTALIKNWEEKIDVLSRMALDEDIRLFSGVPSWMLIFMNKYKEIFPDRELLFKNIFPNLEMIVHGGVNFAPYYDAFKTLMVGSKATLREVYPASEGFIAMQDRGYGEGLRMVLDSGIFYEFVPLEELGSRNPTVHHVGNIEKDINYAIVMTNCTGFWRYILGDTVKFIETNPPRLFITGRTSYYLSSFGEHLILEEVEDAVVSAAKSIDKQIADYSVGTLFPKDTSELGGHLYIVEFKGEIPNDEDIKKFADKIDKVLCKRNEDYEAHRAEGYGLNPPKIKAVKPGTFAMWMASRGKLGGQNKVPRIINNEELFNSLREFKK